MPLIRPFRKPRYPLFLKISLTFLLVMIIPTILSGLFINQVISQNMQERIIEQLRFGQRYFLNLVNSEQTRIKARVWEFSKELGQSQLLREGTGTDTEDMEKDFLNYMLSYNLDFIALYDRDHRPIYQQTKEFVAKTFSRYEDLISLDLLEETAFKTSYYYTQEYFMDDGIAFVSVFPIKEHGTYGDEIAWVYCGNIMQDDFISDMKEILGQELIIVQNQDLNNNYIQGKIKLSSTYDIYGESHEGKTFYREEMKDILQNPSENLFVYQGKEEILGTPMVSAYFPIKTSGLDTYMGIVAQDPDEKLRDRLFKYLAVLISLVLLLTLTASLILTKAIVIPVRHLVKGIRNLSGQIVEEASYTPITLKNRDELGFAARSFNAMAENLLENHQTISNLNRVYRYFVPRQFLSALNRGSITEVTLGDQKETSMAVMFTDIRSFTTLSEQMTPEENFRFLNSYLKRLGPVIRHYDGFIDKYIGDAVMALFSDPHKAAHAVIQYYRTLEEYNHHRSNCGYQPIQIGTGLSFGRMILGIIGEEERMEGTVISDKVNLASRLEGMTKFYQVRLLVDKEMAAHLTGYEGTSLRYLDHVMVKGRTSADAVYQVIEAEPPQTAEAVLVHRETFAHGVELYQNRDFKKALGIFLEILNSFPEDRPSQLYAERCENALKQNISDAAWDWTLRMDKK